MLFAFVSAMARRFSLGLLFALSLAGATLERLSFEDMIEKSTAIVRGRVAGSYDAFRGQLIYTHYRIEILERWKGPQQASVEVMVPGGSVGAVRQSYSGAPQLKRGQEYVLFLWTGRSGTTQVIGFTQGLFQLSKSGGQDWIALRPAATETMLEPGTGRVVRDEPLRMRLQELSSRISRTLQGVAASSR
jgi:hypothetical protein